MRAILLVLLVLFLNTFTNAQSVQEKKVPVNTIRKNSVYIELGGLGLMSSLNYDRIFTITNKFAFVPRLGVGFFEEMFPLYELNLIFGGPKHFIETGFGQNVVYNYMIKAGYRYQGEKGFLLRAAPQFLKETMEDEVRHGFFFGLSIGYSF